MLKFILVLAMLIPTVAQAAPEWSISCKVDKFTDERSCRATSQAARTHQIFVDLNSKRTWLSFGVSDKVSGKVRVNKNPVEYGGTIFARQEQVQRIILQMMEGGSAIVSLTTWPNEVTEYSFDLTGFDKVMRNLALRAAHGCTPERQGQIKPSAPPHSPTLQAEIDQAVKDSAAAGDCT